MAAKKTAAPAVKVNGEELHYEGFRGGIDKATDSEGFVHLRFDPGAEGVCPPGKKLYMTGSTGGWTDVFSDRGHMRINAMSAEGGRKNS
jgi:hypothetical protein